MQVKFRIRRFDPDTDRPASHFQDYELEMTEANTVLDGLIQIREDVDGTLALRCSCRSAICGS
ncbi:MAG: succinate dehydrogenase, partial [Chloroflexi bacterium]|nr:succinate dehydrogenase [Chloroflexota bacterium]